MRAAAENHNLDDTYLVFGPWRGRSFLRKRCCPEKTVVCDTGQKKVIMLREIRPQLKPKTGTRAACPGKPAVGGRNGTGKTGHQVGPWQHLSFPSKLKGRRPSALGKVTGTGDCAALWGQRITHAL